MIFSWLKRRRRRRALAQPFPETWEGYLKRNFAYWRVLDDQERDRMRDLIRVFIGEKYWEGCGGLALTDEIKVTIAAQACLLLLNIEHDYYPMLKTILVYPSGYFAPGQPSAGGVVSQSPMAVLGQAHHRGPVILSWQHVVQGGRNPGDGHNLVYHEFAHKLDMADGIVDGTPVLATREQHQRWVQVMTREFEALINSHSSGAYWGSTLLRPYGATNPGEFFAVATEVFFEQPLEMLDRHPELYDVLRMFYKQDPAAKLQALIDRPG